jgi:hypothetical protein
MAPKMNPWSSAGFDGMAASDENTKAFQVAKTPTVEIRWQEQDEWSQLNPH